MTLKIKRFGKNKIAFKKLVADENTKFCYEGREAREIFIVNTTYEIEII